MSTIGDERVYYKRRYCLIYATQVSNQLRHTHSFAKSCNFNFHNFTRTPLLPPESAFIYIHFASGYVSRPILYHHLFMLSIANSAVSLLMPTLTNPAFFIMSYTPYGVALLSSFIGKSWSSTLSGSPF